MKIKKMEYCILSVLIISLVSTSGCAIVSQGRINKITMESVDKIKPGTSTKDDIIKLFDKPQQIIYKPDGIQVFVYKHGVEKSLALPFIISIGRSSGNGQTLCITFQGDTVIDYSFTLDERPMVE